MLTFELRLPFDSKVITSFKRELAAEFPDAKSSHRAEAIARCLGFGTNAAMLTAARKRATAPVTVDGSRAAQFLLSRNHAVELSAIYAAAAKVAIRLVMAAEPMLSSHGYHIGRPKRKPAGQWETAREIHSRFQAERQALLGERDAAAFLQSLALLQQFRTIQTFNHNSGSYGLKHAAEGLKCCFPDGSPLINDYVANGTFIVAAVHQGFRYKTFTDHLGYENVNVAFNASAPSIDDALVRSGMHHRLTAERAERARRRISKSAQQDHLG